jgi:hypothetical protein
LQHPSSPAVARAAAELAPRVAYHAWLQGEVQRQLRDVRAAARDVGVRVVHDLAVGCDPEGFDGWAWQDVLALGALVGAPPDAFSQQGQDWGLPPWRPDRLDATGFAAYRDLNIDGVVNYVRLHDFERRRLSVVVEAPDGAGRRLLITKGAPETMLDRCAGVSEHARRVLADEFVAGNRVVAVATRPAPGLTVVTESTITMVTLFPDGPCGPKEPLI